MREGSSWSPKNNEGLLLEGVEILVNNFPWLSVLLRNMKELVFLKFSPFSQYNKSDAKKEKKTRDFKVETTLI